MFPSFMDHTFNRETFVIQFIDWIYGLNSFVSCLYMAHWCSGEWLLKVESELEFVIVIVAYVLGKVVCLLFETMSQMLLCIVKYAKTQNQDLV